MIISIYSVEVNHHKGLHPCWISCWIGWGGEKGGIGLAFSGVVGRGGRGGREGSRSRHARYNFTYMHRNFSLTFSLSQKCFCTVPVILLPFALVFSAWIMERSTLEKKAGLSNQNPSARLFNVSLFSDTASLSYFHCLALAQKHSSPSSHLLLISLLWYLLALEFLQDLYLESLNFPPILSVSWFL